MNREFRKPNLFDKISGCIDWFIFGIECLVKRESVVFAKDMFIETLKGNFKVKREDV